MVHALDFWGTTLGMAMISDSVSVTESVITDYFAHGKHIKSMIYKIMHVPSWKGHLELNVFGEMADQTCECFSIKDTLQSGSLTIIKDMFQDIGPTYVIRTSKVTLT